MIAVLDNGNSIIFGKRMEPETFQVVSGRIEHLPEQRIGCYPHSFEEGRSRAAIDHVFSRDMACPGTTNDHMRNGVAYGNSPWLPSTTIEKLSIPELKGVIKMQNKGFSPSSVLKDVLEKISTNNFSPSLAREVVVQEWMEDVDGNFYMRDKNDNPELQDFLTEYKWRRKRFTPGAKKEFDLGDVEGSFMERVMRATNNGIVFSSFTKLVLGNHYLPVEVTERLVSRHRPVLAGMITKGDMRTVSNIRGAMTSNMIGLFDTIGKQVTLQDETTIPSPPITSHVGAVLPLMMFEEGENEVAKRAIDTAIQKVVKTGTINDLFVLVGEAGKADQKITAKRRHVEEVFKKLEQGDAAFVRDIEELDRQQYALEDKTENAGKYAELADRMAAISAKRDENIEGMQAAWREFDEMPEFISLERFIRNTKL